MQNLLDTCIFQGLDFFHKDKLLAEAGKFNFERLTEKCL